MESEFASKYFIDKYILLFCSNLVFCVLLRTKFLPTSLASGLTGASLSKEIWKIVRKIFYWAWEKFSLLNNSFVITFVDTFLIVFFFVKTTDITKFAHRLDLWGWGQLLYLGRYDYKKLEMIEQSCFTWGPASMAWTLQLATSGRTPRRPSAARSRPQDASEGKFKSTFY